jgi:hypothetical protein
LHWLALVAWGDAFSRAFFFSLCVFRAGSYRYRFAAVYLSVL